MYVAYSPFICQSQSQQTLQLHSWLPIQSLSQLPREYSALNTGLVNRRDLRTHTSTITEVNYLNAKYPLHLGGVKQWLKEDLLNSAMPWLGLEPGTSASAV